MEPKSSRVAERTATSQHISGSVSLNLVHATQGNPTLDARKSPHTFRDIFLDPDPRITLWERVKGGASLSLLPFALFCGGSFNGTEDAGINAGDAISGKDVGYDGTRDMSGEVQCDPDTYVPDNRFGNNYDGCGRGVCNRTVPITICVDGKIVRNDKECVPGKPLSVTDVTCDNIDDDCDGRIDEDFESRPTGRPCGDGLGACQDTEWMVCRDLDRYSDSYGERIECRSGSSPTFERCNDGVDNDCDGRVDEGDDWHLRLGEPCDVGLGVCHREGIRECAEDGIGEDGRGWVCSVVPGEPAGVDDNCNGLDDDCDGAIDEHFAIATSICGEGPCQITGELHCFHGELVEYCIPLSRPMLGISNLDYACNGIDDDCDGETDEDYTNRLIRCGIGVCGRSSINETECIDGTEVEPQCVPGEPTGMDNDCNSRDEDCDGRRDEHFQSIETVCMADGNVLEGHLVCVNGSLECISGSCTSWPCDESDSEIFP